MGRRMGRIGQKKPIVGLIIGAAASAYGSIAPIGSGFDLDLSAVDPCRWLHRSSLVEERLAQG